MDDPTNRQLLQDHFTTLKTGADTVATASQEMAAPIKDYHDATVALGNDNTTAINALELSISLIAITAGVAFLFSLGSSAVAAATAIDADVALTINAIQTSYRASQMVRIIGLTSLAAGAVGTIDAFHALPAVDLDKAVAGLAAIIGMTSTIDDDHAGDSDEPDFRHSEYTQAEIEEFINGHTGDGNPAMKGPTAAEVHDAPINGTPEPMGDGRTAEQAEQFVYKGIKVVVNYEMPWKSTAWKLP